MKKNQGGTRLRKMMLEGKIPLANGVFIDAYNGVCHEDIAATITTRISAANHYYVTEIADKGKTIVPINTDSDGCAKTILSGCYKFGVKTLLAWNGASMTSIAESDNV